MEISRVLRVDPEHGTVITIDVRNDNALPTLVPLDDVAQRLDAGELMVPDSDPFAPIDVYDLLPRKRQAVVDRAWETISTLVTDPGIFLARTRGQLIAEAVRLSGHHKEAIYRWLRRYWQGGQLRDALIPHFEKCGGRGKRRPAGQKKRGRPRLVSAIDSEQCGVNVDELTKDKILKCVRKHLNRGVTYQQLYELLLYENFTFKPEGDGQLAAPIPLPETEVLTFGQFIYWVKALFTAEELNIMQSGERRHLLKGRGLTGSTSAIANRPGSMFAIDSTQGDIHLVSTIDGGEIGRPTIYLVTDMASEMITGFCVSLKPPSWAIAMVALENALTEKVSFCSQYGKAISEDDWPCHHLPDAIIADRGELAGKSADALPQRLDIAIANTPPYRPDLKGVVEQAFRLVNLAAIHGLPGGISGPRERGDPEPDGLLDIRQFTRVLIQAILDHNRHFLVRPSVLTEAMARDNVELTPISLWNWGVETLGLRTCDRERVRRSLLPRGEASVTEGGILFQGVYYICPTAVAQGWLASARIRGVWRVQAIYDPRDTEAIYISPDEGRSWEIANRMPKSELYAGRAWDEVAAHRQKLRLSAAANEQSRRQGTAELLRTVEMTVQEAQQKSHDTPEELQNSRGIRNRRSAEIRATEGTQSWIGSGHGTGIQSQLQLPPETPLEAPLVDDLALLRQVRAEEIDTPQGSHRRND